MPRHGRRGARRRRAPLVRTCQPGRDNHGADRKRITTQPRDERHPMRPAHPQRGINDDRYDGAGDEAWHALLPHIDDARHPARHLAQPAALHRNRNRPCQRYQADDPQQCEVLFHHARHWLSLRHELQEREAERDADGAPCQPSAHARRMEHDRHRMQPCQHPADEHELPRERIETPSIFAGARQQRTEHRCEQPQREAAEQCHHRRSPRVRHHNTNAERKKRIHWQHGSQVRLVAKQRDVADHRPRLRDEQRPFAFRQHRRTQTKRRDHRAGCQHQCRVHAPRFASITAYAAADAYPPRNTNTSAASQNA
ncbi:hypothetical protein DFQ30_009119 [Apophysomyces sp. BC1015]|nr:hypothetical protein DFQ30_009119 [Apophysomyces sp. BC1015]